MVNLLVSAATVLLLMFISTQLFWRIDLTSEKRYSLSPVSKQILSNLNDVVYIQVYLEGELPIGFSKMQRSLRETLDEFRIYAHENLQYVFVNPSESGNAKEREAIYAELYNRGIEPTNIYDRDKEGGSIQKVLFPGAMISYKGKELPLNLLKNNPALSGDENINRSIQAFEFTFIDAIERLSIDTLPKLAFIEGHGELNQFQTGDLAQTLSGRFKVDYVELNGNVGQLKDYSIVVVAGPTAPIPETHKLVLDQYVMQGGRMIWLVDPVRVNADSLSRGASTIAMPNQHNLDDMLFRYGVRLNSRLVQDIQCAVIPVNVALAGQDPRFAPAPWPFYPLLAPPANHPVTRNLNLVKTEFISSIDLVSDENGISKTVLLSTSQNSRELQAPLFVSLSQIEMSPRERDYHISNLPVAVVLEGEFSSNFTNRPLSSYNNGAPFTLKPKGVSTKMAVIADADIIRNDVRLRPDGALITPLGYDRYTKQTFGNKEFMVNLVSYLTDDAGLLGLRSKEFKLRLLDKKKISEERLKWQVINLALPSLLLVLLGVAWFYVRRYRFSRRES